MIEDLERELVRAMAKEVADLPAPSLDLHRMQHHRPARRLVVPGVAVGVAMVVATPLAAAHSGIFRSAPAADKHLPASTPAGPGVPAAHPLPSFEPTQAVPDTCTAWRRTLSAAEHAAAARQLRAAFDDVARRVLGAGASRQVAPLSAADVNRLLPPAGAMITYYDCSLGQTLTPQQRAAAVAEVRRAVTDAETALLAARSAIEHALGNGKLPSWLGDLDLHMVSRTENTMVVRLDLGTPRPGWPASGSITVTIRLADRAVVSIQPSGLKLPPGLPVPKIPAAQIPVSLPPLPVPVPLPPQVPGLPTGGR